MAVQSPTTSPSQVKYAILSLFAITLPETLFVFFTGADLQNRLAACTGTSTLANIMHRLYIDTCVVLVYDSRIASVLNVTFWSELCQLCLQPCSWIVPRTSK